MIRIKQATAVNRHLAAWRQLAVLVGDPCLPPGELVDDLQNGVADFEWCPLVERTLAASPEVGRRLGRRSSEPGCRCGGRKSSRCPT